MSRPIPSTPSTPAFIPSPIPGQGRVVKINMAKVILCRALRQSGARASVQMKDTPKSRFYLQSITTQASDQSLDAGIGMVSPPPPFIPSLEDEVCVPSPPSILRSKSTKKGKITPQSRNDPRPPKLTLDSLMKKLASTVRQSIPAAPVPQEKTGGRVRPSIHSPKISTVQGGVGHMLEPLITLNRQLPRTASPQQAANRCLSPSVRRQRMGSGLGTSPGQSPRPPIFLSDIFKPSPANLPPSPPSPSSPFRGGVSSQAVGSRQVRSKPLSMVSQSSRLSPSSPQPPKRRKVSLLLGDRPQLGMCLARMMRPSPPV